MSQIPTYNVEGLQKKKISSTATYNLEGLQKKSTLPTNVDQSGLIEKGNIDLAAQPSIPNPETGGMSTVFSTGKNFGDGEVLLTRVTPDGKFLSEKEAVDYYQKTGRHLGKFKTVEAANAYAKQLHEDYESGKIKLKSDQTQSDFDWNKPTAEISGQSEGRNPNLTPSAETPSPFMEKLNGIYQAMDYLPVPGGKLGQIANKAFVGSVMGTTQGIKELGEVNIADPSAIAKLPAAAIKTVFGAAGTILPPLMAFNTAIEGLKEVVPEEYINAVMAPISSMAENGVFVIPGISGGTPTIIPVGKVGSTGKATAEIFDLVYQGLIFKGFHGLAYKMKTGEPFTPEDRAEIAPVINEVITQYKAPFKASTLAKIPDGIGSDTKLIVGPLIERKVLLEAEKEKVDEDTHPFIDEQIKAVKQEIKDHINAEVLKQREQTGLPPIAKAADNIPEVKKDIPNDTNPESVVGSEQPVSGETTETVKPLDNVVSETVKTEAPTEEKVAVPEPLKDVENPFKETQVKDVLYRGSTGGRYGDGKGFYFTPNKEYAKIYTEGKLGKKIEGAKISAYHVDVKNPLRIETKGAMGAAIDKAYDEAVKNGYDSIIATNGEISEVVVFDKSQTSKINEKAVEYAIAKEVKPQVDVTIPTEKPTGDLGGNGDAGKTNIESSIPASDATAAETRNPVETVGGTEQPKSSIDIARENRKAAKAKLDGLYKRMGVIDNPEEKAQALFDYHKALVKEAGEYIKEGVKTVQEFADKIGDEVSVVVRKAWDEATGKAVIEKPEDLKYTTEENSFTGNTIEQTNEAARTLGLPEYEKSPETFEQWDAEAQQRIELGEMPGLIKRLESGKTLDSPVEQRMLAKYAADLLSKADKYPSDENINRYQHFKELSDIMGGRKAGQILAARKGSQSIMDNVADMYVDKKTDLNVDTLTEEQKTEIRKQHDEYVKIRDEAALKLKEVDEAMSRLNAEKELRKQKQSTPRVKRTHEDYQTERAEITKNIREKLKNIRQSTQAAVVPYARELVEITPDVAKLVKSYLSEGIDKLDDIVARIHADIKEAIPQATTKDVHDMIAGEYKKAPKTKSALQLQQQELKTEARLINQLDRLMKGEQPKTEKSQIEHNQRVKDLQDKIKGFKEEKIKAEREQKAENNAANKKPADQVALERVKSRAETTTKKIADRLAKGEFEPVRRTPFTDRTELKKKFPQLWKDTMDAIAAKEDMQHEYEIGRIKEQMSKRNKVEKILDIGKGIIATGKALRQGIDDSAVFVQDIVALVAHPISGAKALKGHLSDFWSEKKYTRWLTDLHSNTFSWHLIQKSGLDITDPKALRQSGREEPYSNNLLDKTFTIKGKKVNIGKYTIRPFERMFTGLGNRLRADAFLRMAEKMYEKGLTIETHEKEFTDLAKILNNETGRGKLPLPIQNAQELITPFIWSPRLLASSLNIIGLSDPFYAIQGKRGYYASLTPKMRAYAIGDFAKYVGATVSVMGLMGLAGWESDLDPTSVTFGMIKKDGKSINMFGRFSGVVKTAAQMATGLQTKNDLTTPMSKDKLAMLPLHFLRGKLTPAAGTAVDLWTGTTYMGKEVTLKDELLQNVTPLSAVGIASGLKNEGLSSIFTTGLPSFLGLNISYEADFKREVPSAIKVSGKQIDLTDTQKHEFQDSFDAKKEVYTTKLINTPEYNSADDVEKAKMQRTVLDAAMSESETELKRKYHIKESEVDRRARIDEQKKIDQLKKQVGIKK